MNRGEVILVSVPYLSGNQTKRSPAVILQADSLNKSRSHTIIAAISSRVGNPVDPAHFVLDPVTAEGKRSGVHFRSVVRCDRIFTIEQRDVLNVIGSLEPATMRGVDACVRIALGLN